MPRTYEVPFTDEWEANLQWFLANEGKGKTAVEVILLWLQSSVESHTVNRERAEAKDAVALKTQFDKAAPEDTKAKIAAAVEEAKPKPAPVEEPPAGEPVEP
jgi:hypothetical protein